MGRSGTENEEDNQKASFLREDLWEETFQTHALMTPETHNLSTFFLSLITIFILINSVFIKKKKV